jgi:hypothetical protein
MKRRQKRKMIDIHGYVNPPLVRSEGVTHRRLAHAMAINRTIRHMVCHTTQLLVASVLGANHSQQQSAQNDGFGYHSWLFQG